MCVITRKQKCAFAKACVRARVRACARACVHACVLSRPTLALEKHTLYCADHYFLPAFGSKRRTGGIGECWTSTTASDRVQGALKY